MSAEETGNLTGIALEVLLGLVQVRHCTCPLVIHLFIYYGPKFDFDLYTWTGSSRKPSSWMNTSVVFSQM